MLCNYILSLANIQTLSFAVLPTDAILRLNGTNGIVTNHTMEVKQGAQLIVNCGGGQNPNWKMGATNITTSNSANVYQFRHGIAVLFIKSVKPSNAGTYICHFNRTYQESITLGES